MKKSDYRGRSWAETGHKSASSAKPCPVSRALQGLTLQVTAMVFCPAGPPSWPRVTMDTALQGSTRQH